MSIRLAESHTLVEKLRELENFMIENGITLEWDGYHMIFSDNNFKAFIRDSDNGSECNMIPHTLETKLVSETPHVQKNEGNIL
jgi:hypothetical protein